jgi:hypothetical protein
MTEYPFAFPALAIGPAPKSCGDNAEDVQWFFADNPAMSEHVRRRFKRSGLSGWSLFDSRGDCWRIVDLASLPPAASGWKRTACALFRCGRQFRFVLEAQSPVPFKDILQRVHAIYNKEAIIWESIGGARGLQSREEEEVVIEAEIAVLMSAKDLPDLIARLQDLNDRRQAESR